MWCILQIYKVCEFTWLECCVFYRFTRSVSLLDLNVVYFTDLQGLWVYLTWMLCILQIYKGYEFTWLECCVFYRFTRSVSLLDFNVMYFTDLQGLWVYLTWMWCILETLHSLLGQFIWFLLCMILYTPGPSNSHSSPATRFCPSSLSKSRMARRRSAELATTTLSGVTGCFNTSPGYRGNGSCVSLMSYKHQKILYNTQTKQQCDTVQSYPQDL